MENVQGVNPYLGAETTSARDLSLEAAIVRMGFAFRDLTHHSDGQFSVRLGASWYPNMKGLAREFWGTTPLEAIEKAERAVEEYENRERDLD